MSDPSFKFCPTCNRKLWYQQDHGFRCWDCNPPRRKGGARQGSGRKKLSYIPPITQTPYPLDPRKEYLLKLASGEL